MKTILKVDKLTGIGIFFASVLILLVFGMVCCTNNSQSEKNVKNILETVDYNELIKNNSVIVEDVVEVPSGHIQLCIIKGHEYAVFYTSHYQNTSQSIQAIHLKESCIGCELEEKGMILSDTIVHIDGHLYVAERILKGDKVVSCKLEHLCKP